MGDIGGLGKGYEAEFVGRHNIPMEAADKENKIGFIKLMNGELERGMVKILPEECGDLVTEWKSLPWNKQHTGEASGFPNHCADGVLYGWRWCRSYAAKTSVAVSIPGTQEWEDAQAEKRRREYAEKGRARRLRLGR
jgi:hypothetical protein